MDPNPHVAIGAATFGNDLPLALIAGPCQLESRDHAFDIAGRLQEMTAALGMGFVYKTSFDKANRTSLTGTRGAGLDRALSVFAELRQSLGVPILTDVHEPDQCAEVAGVVDVLQIPAFLCRQTDLLVAAARTGKAVNVKKGQFLAPWDMRNVLAKITDSGNANVLLTERGASFGYNTLVSDMRSLPIMAETGAPVIFDATHSVQQPGGQGTSTGRRAALRAGACARGGCRRRRRRLYRDPRGSRSRSVRWPEHDSDRRDAGVARDPAGCRSDRQEALRPALSEGSSGRRQRNAMIFALFTLT